MTRRPAVAALALAAAVVASAPSAGADDLVLKNGRTLSGKVTESGDLVVLERPGMRMDLRRDEVAEIRRAPTAREELATRLSRLDPKDAEAHHRLGLWAASKGLAAEAREAHEKAVSLDGDHAGARRALGQVKWEGKWRDEAALMKERGFVQVDGAWVAAEEADALRKAPIPPERRAALEARAAEGRQRRAINAAFRRLASAEARERAAGERDLVTVARERGDAVLEARAPEVRAYYDGVHAALAEARARATVEVRAQWVTLKRPIQTFETSLGGFSSPVRLQLPEVSVVRINTTVVLPLQIDEWDD